MLIFTGYIIKESSHTTLLKNFSLKLTQYPKGMLREVAKSLRKTLKLCIFAALREEKA